MDSSNKVRENKWKDKAISRRKELKKCKDRITELLESRDLWKSKYKDLKGSCVPQVKNDFFTENSKPENYEYSTVLITLCLRLMMYSGTSLRSCSHFLMQLYITIGLESQRTPSYSTVRLWVCKMGLYLYEEETETEGTWVLIVDESITIGQDKVLLMLGLRSDTWEFKSPVQKKDVSVVYFGISKKWEGEEISKILESLSEAMQINYVVSDRGNNLVKAFKQSKLSHVPDCTHVLAKALERYCKKHTVASDILSASGKLRQKWILGKKTLYVPPSIRKKARFHNLGPVADWSARMLCIWKLMPEEVKSELDFLKRNESSVNEFIVLNSLIESINKVMKRYSYTEKIHEVVFADIDRIRKVGKYSSHALVFLEEVEDYLKELSNLHKKGETLFCCSDIIESTFGSLKYKIPSNSPFGITEFSFALTSLGNNFDSEDVKKAMETISVTKLKEWKDQNIPESLFFQRRKMMRKVGEEVPAD